MIPLCKKYYIQKKRNKYLKEKTQFAHRMCCYTPEGRSLIALTRFCSFFVRTHYLIFLPIHSQSGTREDPFFMLFVSLEFCFCFVRTACLGPMPLYRVHIRVTHFQLFVIFRWGMDSLSLGNSRRHVQSSLTSFR